MAIHLDDKWVVLVKILAMIIMFLLILIVGTLPIRAKNFRSNPRLLSYASAFSGGLFLAVGLIHLIPEAQEDFDSYYESIGSTYKYLI